MTGGLRKSVRLTTVYIGNKWYVCGEREKNNGK